jgi:Domain of unknown function (DUF1918)
VSAAAARVTSRLSRSPQADSAPHPDVGIAAERLNELTMTPKTTTAHVGDWIEARGLHGQPSRHGQIVELLGHDEHGHYRVRWDEQHESILYPADGIIITPQHARPARGASR